MANRILKWALSGMDGSAAQRSEYSRNGETLPGTALKRDLGAEYVIMGVICALTFIVYCHTLCTGVYPGSSAVAMGQVLGLLPGVPVTHPAWLATAKLALSFPLMDVPFKLNLLSALCGCVAAAMVFRVSRRILFEMIRPSPAYRMVPLADDGPASGAAGRNGSNGTGDEECEIGEKLASTLGGVVCAMSFAFFSPVWLAATSLHVQLFDVLLLLVATDWIASYYSTARIGYCVAAISLCGLLLVESPLMAALVPLLMLSSMRACIRFNQMSESFMILLLAAGLLGAMGGIVLYLLVAGGADGAGLNGLLLGFAQNYKLGLIAVVSGDNWVFTLALPALALLLACVGMLTVANCKDDVSRLKWRITCLIVTGYTFAGMLVLPKTLWAVARNGDHLPVLPALIIACTMGVLFAYWYQMATVAAFNADDEQDALPLWRRLAGFGMCGLLVVITLRAIGSNLSDADGRRAQFADSVAQEMLDLAPRAKYLVADGALDMNLLIGAYLKGRRLEVIPASLSESSGAQQKNVGRPRLVRVGDEGLAERSMHELSQWLHDEPSARQLVAVVGSAAVWRKSGYVAVPNGLVYEGMTKYEDPQLPILYAANQMVWRRIAGMMKDDATLMPTLRQVRADIRSHVSRLANDAGALLDRAGRVADAETAYTDALEWDGQNVCAALNRYGLRLRQTNAGVGTIDSLCRGRSWLDASLASPTWMDEMTTRYGALLSQPADSLLPLLLQGYASGVTLLPEQIEFLERWLNAERDSETTREVAPEASALTVAGLMRAYVGDSRVNADLVSAIQVYADGDVDRAARMSRRVVRKHPDNVAALAFLSEILLQKGEHAEVSSSLLPAMRAAASGSENALVLLVQGATCMRANAARYAEARASLKRAIELEPSLVLARDWLMRVDELLGNDKESEADARLVLTLDQSHPGAHALLGRLLYAQGQLGEAEQHLRTCLSQIACAETHHALSLLLLDVKRLAEAEQQARLSIRLAPCRARVWETLGRVLAAAGQGRASAVAYACAQALGHGVGAAYMPLALYEDGAAQPARARMGASAAEASRGGLSQRGLESLAKVDRAQ